MSYKKGLVATLAELEDFYKGQPAGEVIELMNQTNDILSDVQWMESNQSDGHLTRIRTGLPEVYWRRLYKGTPPSKSQWSQVKEVCGMLEALQELDVAEVELYGDKARAFRLSESKAFAEAMRQKVASTLFYGDNGATPDEFNGFAMRYPSTSSPNVITAGGSTANKETSMYCIAWGADTVHGLYPKGSTGGLHNEDLGKYMTTDSGGNKFQCVGDKYNWRCGLAVRDWRAVVRICNIDSTKLTVRKGQTGYIDLQALTIKAKNLMPANMRNRAIWYCNQDVLTALELQAIDNGNVQLVYGEQFNSKAVPFLHGRPIRQCDAIVSTEAVLS
ncbi:MAG: hypothetical protein E7022_05890 [Desulfovibrio desulfuricans]|nr:hypothetical protein [Desulfovibrio desulfuricans]